MAKDFKNKVGAGNPILNNLTGANTKVETPEPEQAQAIEAKETTRPLKKKVGKPKTRGPVYRINLALDADLEDFLKEQAWKEKKTVTELLNDLARDYKARVNK